MSPPARSPTFRWLLPAAISIVAVPACPSLTGPPPLVWPASPASAPTSPGPAPRRRSFDAAALNTQCEGCHTEIAAEWRASLHRAAHTDPAYRSQFAREPFPFCTACHAPEASPTEEVPEALSQLGVGCVTCHVTGDAILAAPRSEGTAHDGEHHALTRTAAFEGPPACGACHEFAFPGPRRGREPLLMQSTMQEHAASSHADRTCASCHMPVVSGGPGGRHRSHTFSASRDEAFVRSAIVVEEAPFVNGTLTLTLRPGAVGHAFPTGDMLRRLALVIDVQDHEGASIEHEERSFARHFGSSRQPNTAPRRILVKDDRVGTGADPIVFNYTPKAQPAGGHLHYTLRYERVTDPTAGDDGRPLVDSSILLAEKTLPLTPAQE